MNHVILFEHDNFRGMSKHVYGPEPDLNTGRDDSLNDKVSSIIVVSGTWSFFRHAGYNGRYARTLGPGEYPWVGALDIQNDDMSSLHPENHPPATEVHESDHLPHIILFEHANFLGLHRHVFGPVPSLDTDQEIFFNDKVSSIVVLAGTWRLFRHVNYVGEYPIKLGPGAYPWVGAVEIQNDDMSSLKPVLA